MDFPCEASVGVVMAEMDRYEAPGSKISSITADVVRENEAWRLGTISIDGIFHFLLAPDV